MFPKLHTPKNVVATRPVSEHPSAVNILTGFKHRWSMQKSTFILHFHHSDIDIARKRPS